MPDGRASPHLGGSGWYASGIVAESSADICPFCTWAWRPDLGKMALKTLSASCREHSHLTGHGGIGNWALTKLR